MPTLYDLKPRFQSLLRPCAARLAERGVTANRVTLAALALSLAAGALAAAMASPWVFLLWPPLLLVRMGLNAIDGMLAREHGQRSRLGALLNEIGDVVSDAALTLPFALLPGAAGWPVILFAFLAALSEFAGVLALSIGATRRYDGPLGKSDRALLLGTLALAIGIGFDPGGWFDLAWAAGAVLALATVANRLRAALREAAK